MKRKHRHIMEIRPTLLSHSSIPIKFWDHSFAISMHVINRLPTIDLTKFHSLFHALYLMLPNYQSMKVFEWPCFLFTRPYNTQKLEFRSEKYIYLGVSSQHNDFKCLRKSRKVFISKDVVFHEHHFPLHAMFQCESNSLSQSNVKSK